MSKGDSRVRRATKPRLTGQTKRDIRAYLADRDGRHCHYCRRPFGEDLAGVSLDHYIPHCLWRMNKPRNLVLACRPCNDTKADWLPFTLAWLLLAHTTGPRAFTRGPRVFTADLGVFITAAGIGAASRCGRVLAAAGSAVRTVAFTVSVNTFTAGREPGQRTPVGCRAVLPPIGTGRTLTWPDGPRGTAVNTARSAVNTCGSADPIGTGSADPTAARPGAGSALLNTVSVPLNTTGSDMNTAWAVVA
jgi:hypothetical protein